jgi:endonuclease/exonuclease/phosphatase family metal-dependent hydrolase
VQQRGLSAVFAPVREVGGRVRGNAILASMPLLDPHTIVLPRERQPRSAVAATVSILGQRMFLVSAHLENRLSWRRGGLFSDGARGRQAAALLAALPPDEPGIVGADLNTWLGPAEPAWKQMLRRFPDTPPRAPSDATFHKRLILDHLFFDVPDEWQVSRRVLPDAYGSDHSPVLGLIYR